MLLGLIGVRRAADRKEGSRAVLALSWYAAVRILYESLRQDDIPKWGFVRVNQILGAVLLLLLLILCYLQVRKGLGVSLGLLLGGVVVAGAMEFALEKKIRFLQWMRMDLCYLVMACASLGLILICTRVWRRAYASPEALRARVSAPVPAP